MAEARRVLVTGADGYLGGRIARRWLEATADDVLLWVRAADPAGFSAKRQRLAEAFRVHGPRVAFAWGDLLDDDPFRRVDPNEVRFIVHAAAQVRFGLDRETARRVNVEGTAKLLRLAAACPGLEALGLVSSLYATGLLSGPVAETTVLPPGFANHYEWSKWAAEETLVRGFGGLPWHVFRVATVIADDEAGRVVQHNVFHNTLRLLYHGLLSTVPGRPETPLYFVTAAFVAESVVEVMRRAPPRRVWHVAHRRSESSTLDEVIDAVVGVFEGDEAFRRRGGLRPLYMDEEAFGLLVEAARQFSGGIVAEALDSVAPFARQLFVSKDVANGALAGAAFDYRAPDPAELVRRTCAELVRTRWGKQRAVL